MERRMSVCSNQVSPERAKVWMERSSKYVQYRKVSVVYYLCTNQRLEHPHFVEINLSSNNDLYLRDFISRLRELRGQGMVARYSWSCKRSYKTGFVWHDLCEDDLIHPASGSEYVLKGSELIEEPNSKQIVPSENMAYQNHKQLLEPISRRSRNGSSTTSSLNGKEQTLSLECTYSPNHQPGSCSVSIVNKAGKIASPVGNLSLVEYKVGITEKAANASTQTEENHIPGPVQETCTRGVSTEDGPLMPALPSTPEEQIPCANKSVVMSRASEFPHPSCSTESSSAEKTETLESLIKADAKKMIKFGNLEEEDISLSPNVRVKATNMIRQLISCGSITVKDRSVGLIPTYKPRFSSSKSPSPLYSSSVLLGEMDYLYDSPRKMGLKTDDKEYSSGSLIEAKMLKGIGCLSTLKRSSSFDDDRTSKLSIAEEEQNEVPSRGSKCIPISIKASIGRHPSSESMKSPLSDKPRKSTEFGMSHTTTPCVSVGNSKSIRDTVVKRSPKSSTYVSFREDNNITQMEERIASGARIIIQSKPASDIN